MYIAVKRVRVSGDWFWFQLFNGLKVARNFLANTVAK